IRFKEYPETELGLEVMEAIISKSLENKDLKSPVSINVYGKKINSETLTVQVWEKDKNVSLLGPAALNEIWVNNGNIIGVIPDEQLKEKGVFSGITYLKAIAALAASKIEEMIASGGKELSIRIKISKQMSDINLDIPKSIRRFITANKRKIDVRGPVFIGISAKLE
ncbi:MAG: hypothetical protein ACTSYQ_04015, partial [Candidatus Odinarchaeia archaeon]